MRLVLEAAHGVQLEPLLVAQIGSALFVVDGHHRLKAYRQAGRESAPARVMPLDRRGAVLVSKLVNCEARALEMHPEQRRDAAWQYVAHLTRQGVDDLPSGESLRTVAGRFGISKDTVSNMLRKLPKVNPKAYPAEQCDSGTGFPRWKVVRDWRKQNEEDDLGGQPMNREQWTRREAERVAKRLGMLESGTTAEAWKLALMMYAAEAKLEAANDDTRTFLAEIAETTEGDY
jgi:ParB-like chromosome segregation protein Spo0J